MPVRKRRYLPVAQIDFTHFIFPRRGCLDEHERTTVRGPGRSHAVLNEHTRHASLHTHFVKVGVSLFPCRESHARTIRRYIRTKTAQKRRVGELQSVASICTAPPQR